MNNSKFLITGATGLIGASLVRHLQKQFPKAQIVLPVRDRVKAERMFGTDGCVTILGCDLFTTDFEFAGDVDYIVHCAAPTDNKYFVEHPIDTFNSILYPTQHLLDYATRHTTVKGVVYLSSLEVYGTIANGTAPISENACGLIDLQSARSSYPMAKRAAEHLCSLYAQQYRVPVSIARLTQTTGTGVPYSDNKVINAFCRSAVENEDIILLTSGKSSRPYCHVDDAVAAIMVLLEKGEHGEAYNIANESTYISAHQLALFVKEHLNPSIHVKTKLKSDSPFAPPSHLPLATSKLQSLGWHPVHGLEYICNDVYNHYRKMKQHEA